MSGIGVDIRSTMLMGFLFSLLLVVGYIVGNGSYYIMSLFFVLALVINIGAFWYSDRLVLAMYRAKILEGSEYHGLQEMVERLATQAGIPKPRVAVIPSQMPNAFATGRDPSSSVVAVTQGSIESLTDDELEGVISHEMGHIRNRDTLVMVLAAAIAGAIGYMAFWARWSLLTGGARRDQGGGSVIGLILVAVLIPLAAVIIRMAISRNREYGADRAGAEISGKPGSLASALEKIESISRRKPARGGNAATSHLFIVNPFRGDAIARVFSTHPPTEDRVRRLRQIESEQRYGRVY